MERPEAHKRRCAKIVQPPCFITSYKIIPLTTITSKLLKFIGMEFCFTGIKNYRNKKKALLSHFSFKLPETFICLFYCLSFHKQQANYATKTSIMKKIIRLFSISLFLLSCNSYYKVLTVQNPAGTACKQAFDMKNRYFIFHSDSAVYAMEDISLTNNNTELKYRLAELPVAHMLHLDNIKTKKFKYRTGKGEYDESIVLNEINIYSDSDTASTAGTNEIAITKLTKLEILEKDKPKTRKKRTIAWGVATAGIVTGVALIIASSLQSGFK